MVVDYIERYPPDTTAAIFWLKNRQRATWRDKQDVEQTVTAKVDMDATVAVSGLSSKLAKVREKSGK